VPMALSGTATPTGSRRLNGFEISPDKMQRSSSRKGTGFSPQRQRPHINTLTDEVREPPPAPISPEKGKRLSRAAFRESVRDSMHATAPDVVPSRFVLRRDSRSGDACIFVARWLAVYGCVYGPFHAAFGGYPPNVMPLWCDVLLEVVYFLAAVVLGCFVSVHDESRGKEFVVVSDLVQLQLGSVSMWMDIASFTWLLALPWHPFTSEELGPRLPSAFRALRGYRYFRSTSGRSDAARGLAVVTRGIGRLLVMVVMGIHWTSCVWFLVMREGGGLWKHGMGLQDEGFRGQDSYYAMTLNQIAYIFAGQGAPVAQNDMERYFLSSLTPLVQMSMAYVFAELVLLANRMSIMSNRRLEAMAFIQAAMEALGLPREIQGRILRYHGYIQRHHNPDMYEALLNGLSRDLVVEMKRFIFGKLLSDSPMLQDLDEQHTAELVQAFQEIVVSPGDCVIASGEKGDSMYFVIKGQVEVVGDQGQIFTTKRPGDYFGEIALLFPQKPRQAWVVAKTFCVLAQLDKQSFDRIFDSCPEKKAAMITRMKQLPNMRHLFEDLEVQRQLTRIMTASEIGESPSLAAHPSKSLSPFKFMRRSMTDLRSRMRRKTSTSGANSPTDSRSVSPSKRRDISDPTEGPPFPSQPPLPSQPHPADSAPLLPAVNSALSMEPHTPAAEVSASASSVGLRIRAISPEPARGHSPVHELQSKVNDSCLQEILAAVHGLRVEVAKVHAMQSELTAQVSVLNTEGSCSRKREGRSPG